jgi:hypothetical protein
MSVKHLSASSIAAFKACPTRYRLGYVEGIRQAIDPQTLRFGTAWHKGLEVLGLPVGTFLHDLDGEGDVETRITEENRLEIAVELATKVYEAQAPDGVDLTDWAVERETVANALAAYHWLYGENHDYEIATTELEFELPLVNPETLHSTPNYVRVGKIDRIMRNARTGAALIGENKTTSKPIDSGSTYWGRLRLDTQSKFYIVAGRDLQQQEGPFAPGDSPISGLLHDVFHKPSISPKMLTQADSKAFVETGEYCGQKFGIDGMIGQDAGLKTTIIVDGVVAEVEPGKKEGTFALRETPSMFGARLLQALTAEPEKYFARKEIVFTDDELADFQSQCWALQRTMQEMEKSGNWFQNESSCEATFRCSYCSLCYNNVACCDGKTIPPGFKRLNAVAAEQGEVTSE